MSAFSARDGLMLFGSFMLHAMSLGIGQSFGVLYSELLTEFRDVNQWTMGWVASFFTGILLGAGFPSGVLMSIAGHRVSILCGSLLMTVGMVGSAFITEPYHLFITYGLFAGTGASIMLILGSSIVIETFDRRRGLAASVASMGGGAANIALPPLTALSIEEYGWRNTFLLVLGGLCLQGAVIGAYVKIPPKNTDQVHQATTETYQSSLQGCKHFFKFLNKRLLVFTLSGVLMVVAFFIPFNLVPDLMVSRGMSLFEGSWAATGMGIGSIAGRIVFGLVSDWKCVDRMWMHIFALGLSGVSALAFVFLEDFYQYVIVAVLYGIGTGTVAFLQTVVVFDIVGVEKFGKAFGFLATLEGMACLIGAPVAGRLTDAWGDEAAAFYFAAAMLILGAIVAVPITSSCFRLYDKLTGKPGVPRVVSERTIQATNGNSQMCLVSTIERTSA